MLNILTQLFSANAHFSVFIYIILNATINYDCQEICHVLEGIYSMYAQSFQMT